MARRFRGPAAVAVLALCIAGCPRLGSETTGKSGDAAAPAPAPAPTPSAVPWAANAADVARFTDEELLGPDAVIAHDKTAVRTTPGGGAVVATLPAGAEVVKLSTHGNDDLVWFEDPKSAGRHLTGWVAQSAVKDPAPPPSPSPSPDEDEDAGPPSPAPPEPSGPHGGGHHHPKKKPPHQK